MPTIRPSRRPKAPWFWAFFLAVLAVALAPLQHASAEQPGQDAGDDPWTLCARHAAEIETQSGLPPHLLSAISKVESGRWVAARRSVSAWPWTVTSGGKGRYYATKDEALEAVEALRSSGRRNIDVGCMQINLRYHPDAFEDMHSALDPASNIAYAADLLRRLEREARSWADAIAYYHSRRSNLNGPYRQKVFRVWHEEWRQATIAAGPTDDGAPADLVPALSGFGAETPDVLDTPGGLGQIQLGAFRVADNALPVWHKLQQENTALLGDLEPRIDVVDSARAGKLHLLRVSPVMSAALARSICNQLQDRAVDCLVVSPPRRLALEGDLAHLR